jgi:hypothetical protein
MAKSLNLTNYSSVTLSFSWFIESNWDRNEYIALEFGKGNSWTEIQRLAGNVDPENSWQDVSINVPSDFIVSDFGLRFRATVSDSAEDGNVDNVRIIGLGSSAAASAAYGLNLESLGTEPVSPTGLYGQGLSNVLATGVDGLYLA